MANTTDNLLNDVKAGSALPASNGLLSDAEILRLADQELRTTIAELLVEARSEHWVTYSDQTIVSGTAHYRIPDRAMANGLRDVVIRDSSGNEWSAPPASATDRYLYSSGARLNPGSPFAFAVENGRVVLLPTPAQSGYTLRLRFMARPGALVAPSACAVLASVTASSVVMTGSVPSTISGLANLVDIVRGDGMHEAWAQGLHPTAWNGSTTLTISGVTPVPTSDYDAPLLAAAKVDYVCVAGQTPYPPIPEALWPALVQATKVACLEAAGDRSGMGAALSTLARRAESSKSQIAPRVTGKTERVKPRYSALRRGR